MLIVSPGVTLCNVNTKFYAKERQDRQRADLCMAYPLLLAEMNLTKEAEQ